TNKACHKLDFSREFLKPALKGADGDEKIISLWASISEGIEVLIDFKMSHYYSIYLRLYSFIIREFNLQTKKNELILLAEINRKTLLLFDADKVQVPEVYYRLSERYKHFLLDEFQDTNSAQWIGIRRFLEESIPNGGSLFYVGDVKQAIYDFRGGDPRIFLNIKNEFSQYKYEERVLIENYRSHKAIVDFNNFVFSKSNLDECLGSLDETLNNETILEAYKDSCQNPLPHKTDGYVEIDILTDDKNDEDKLKETLLSIVDDLIGRFEFQDIAILCNKNIEAAKTALWLMEKNLPVESVQNLNIRGNAFIKQIMSLIKFISSPIDKLSFASFVIGEIFLKESAMTKGEIVDFLFQNRDKTKSKTIYTDFRKAYPQIWDKYVEEFFVKAGFIPLYELLVLVLDKFHVINNFPESKIFILRFLELIKDFEVKDCGIKNFIEFFENIDDTDESLFIKNPAGAGIKIMTVHKAKGLQFPAVILPYASLASSKINTPCFIDSDEAIELVKCPTKAAKDFSQKAEQIYRHEKTKGFLSDLNALYVSMTRAELEMRIIVLPKDGVQKNAVKTLFAGFPNKSGQKTKHLAKTKDSEDLRLEDSFEGQYKDIRDVFVDDGKHSFNLRIDKIRSRKKGTIIHFALSKIKTLKGKDENLEIKKVAEIAAAKFPNEDISFVTDDLKSIFADKEIREVFNHDEDLVFNEKEVVDLAGRTIRIDKIIEDGDKVLIFDFKSSAANLKDNTDQIDRYVDVLSQIYPAKKAKGFVVDLQNKKIIEVA
ncbi:MAG: UvrD-helicase domain-containing protein, partial [Elusimicrobiota bacterium]|nr:UvrD-helicase domain-containing protein [Elusimicrobiota bacterium]